MLSNFSQRGNLIYKKKEILITLSADFGKKNIRDNEKERERSFLLLIPGVSSIPLHAGGLEKDAADFYANSAVNMASMRGMF